MSDIYLIVDFEGKLVRQYFGELPVTVLERHGAKELNIFKLMDVDGIKMFTKLGEDLEQVPVRHWDE